MNIRKTILFGLLAFVITIGPGCVTKSGPAPRNQLAAEHQPKNVIIFIGDGCGFNHIKAADYYQCGQLPCRQFEKLPVQLAMTTYPWGGSYDANLAWKDFDYVIKGFTDSAAAATAMATGIKTYNAAIGVDVNKKPVMNLVERAEQLGKSTGVVTSVPFSHATPAGFVAHDPARDDYQGIAKQMINDSPVDVVMGCGNPEFKSNGSPANDPNYKYVTSTDWSALKNGTAGGDADGDGIPDQWTLIQKRGQFQSLAKGNTPKRVFGVPQSLETLQESRDGNVFAVPHFVPFNENVPKLEEMTKAALNILSKDPNGFFVMIEGGAIDWAAHANQSGRLIEEVEDFNKSVDAAIQWVEKHSNWNETLLIVTADHETGYLTGPGSKAGTKLLKPVWNKLESNGIGNQPAMQWNSKNHTNSLVPFFAKGRGAELFQNSFVGLDPIRGPYINNTDIANTIFTLWKAN
jgi:alkaline phosphatase